MDYNNIKTIISPEEISSISLIFNDDISKDINKLIDEEKISVYKTENFINFLNKFYSKNYNFFKKITDNVNYNNIDYDRRIIDIDISSLDRLKTLDLSDSDNYSLSIIYSNKERKFNNIPFIFDLIRSIKFGPEIETIKIFSFFSKRGLDINIDSLKDAGEFNLKMLLCPALVFFYDDKKYDENKKKEMINKRCVNLFGSFNNNFKNIISLNIDYQEKIYCLENIIRYPENKDKNNSTYVFLHYYISSTAQHKSFSYYNFLDAGSVGLSDKISEWAKEVRFEEAGYLRLIEHEGNELKNFVNKNGSIFFGNDLDNREINRILKFSIHYHSKIDTENDGNLLRLNFLYNIVSFKLPNLYSFLEEIKKIKRNKKYMNFVYANNDDQKIACIDILKKLEKRLEKIKVFKISGIDPSKLEYLDMSSKIKIFRKDDCIKFEEIFNFGEKKDNEKKNNYLKLKNLSYLNLSIINEKSEKVNSLRQKGWLFGRIEANLFENITYLNLNNQSSLKMDRYFFSEILKKEKLEEFHILNLNFLDKFKFFNNEYEEENLENSRIIKKYLIFFTEENFFFNKKKKVNTNILHADNEELFNKLIVFFEESVYIYSYIELIIDIFREKENSNQNYSNLFKKFLYFLKIKIFTLINQNKIKILNISEITEAFKTSYSSFYLIDENKKEIDKWNEQKKFSPFNSIIEEIEEAVNNASDVVSRRKREIKFIEDNFKKKIENKSEYSKEEENSLLDEEKKSSWKNIFNSINPFLLTSLIIPVIVFIFWFFLRSGNKKNKKEYFERAVSIKKKSEISKKKKTSVRKKKK